MDDGGHRGNPILLSEHPPARSPCGWFESVRAAPSGDENETAFRVGFRIAVLSQVALELALTTRVRVIASIRDSRSWLLVFLRIKFD